MIIEINKKLIVFIFSGGQNVTLGWEGALDGIAYKFGGPPKNAQYTQSQINLKTTNELKKMAIRNVVGTIRGAVEPDRYVIIGTHRQNLHWKLGQQLPSFRSILAYSETTT